MCRLRRVLVGRVFYLEFMPPTQPTGKPTTQVCSSNSTSTTSTNVTQYVAITGCNLIVNQGYVAVYSSEDTHAEDLDLRSWWRF